MMSQLTKWIAACSVGAAAAGFGMAISPTKASADDIHAVITPAVQTTSDHQTSVPVQQVNWRNGRVRVWAPGVGVYVGPGYGYGYGYGYYRPYRAYGYGYARPIYGPYYGYGPGYGWYGW